MKRSALIAVLLALAVPLCGYYLVKYFSKDAVHMPAHYFMDSVITSGSKPDTVWHQVQSIPFTNQFGEKVSLHDLRGKIVVMNFFFSRCPSICPGLTRNMKRLQDSFTKSDSIVQFVSISVDPEYDSTQKLRAFADLYKVNHDNWWFLTGDKQQVYDFAINEVKANIADPGIDTAFIHTEKFFLLDSNQVVRGFYNGFDTLALAQLARDIPTLMLERDRKSPSIFRELIPILPVIFVAIGLVFIVIVLLQRNKNIKEKSL